MRWPWGTKTVAKTEAIIDGVAWFLLEIGSYWGVFHQQTKCSAFAALRACHLPVKRREMNMPAPRSHSFTLAHFKLEIYGDDTSMGNTRSHPEHDG